MLKLFKNIENYSLEDIVTIHRNSGDIKTRKILENIIFSKLEIDIKKVANSICTRYAVRLNEELFQEGCIILAKCIKVFPIDNGGNFKKYLIASVYGGLKKLASDENECTNNVRPLHEEDIMRIELKMAYNSIEPMDYQMLFEQMLNKDKLLKGIQRDILVNRFGLLNKPELSVKEICNKINITERQYHFNYNKAINKVREYLQK